MNNNYDSLDSKENTNYTPYLIIAIIAILIILFYIVFYKKDGTQEPVENDQYEESESMSPIGISESDTEGEPPMYDINEGETNNMAMSNDEEFDNANEDNSEDDEIDKQLEKLL